MLKKIGIVVAMVIVLLIVVVATRPADFRIERSKTLAAPPAAVYAKLVDFHRWREWSPWETLDPAMTRTFSGPESGPGAIYSWKGNSDVGEGRMTITDAKPSEQVVIRLEFLEPFASTSTTGFALTPTAQGGTNVSWTMTGENNFMMKGMGLFMNMDRMVGDDLNKGLARLDSVTAAPKNVL